MLVKPSQPTKIAITAKNSVATALEVKLQPNSTELGVKSVGPKELLHPRSIKHVTHHQPSSARTLMRQAVIKPPVSFKRQIKVQVATDLQAKPWLSKIEYVPRGKSLSSTRRPQQVAHIQKSPAIDHFSRQTSDRLPVSSWQPPATAQPMAAPSQSPTQAASPKAPQDNLADLFERAIEQATAHEQPPYKLPTLRDRLFRRAKAL
jgi:hypothetical protein